MWQFDLDSSALLVIDMQRDFVEPGGAMEVPMARERLPHMRELIDGARAAKVPVLFTQHVLLDQFNVSPLESSRHPGLLAECIRIQRCFCTGYEPGDASDDAQRATHAIDT